MQPIETYYDGRRYRSRTEARWAVLLKTAEIPFEYEREGYKLPSGWYLPDFWLPKAFDETYAPLWLEVKGQAPTERELRLASELAAATGYGVVFGVGTPDKTIHGDLPVAYAEGVHDTYPVWLSDRAWDAATSERFDGKAWTPPKPALKPMFSSFGARALGQRGGHRR